VRSGAAGMGVLSLEIAGVRLDLVAPGGILPRGLSRYGAFAGRAGPAAFTLLLSEGAGPTGGESELRVVERGGRFCVALAPEAGWLDPARGTGEVCCGEGTAVLDALLRSAVGAAVLSQGGLLVHAAAVEVDGAAHLFPGPSGSGKSTLASRAAHPLSDEVSVLLPASRGFSAHATPWWTSRGGSAPLASVYTLAWDGEGVEPLSGTALRLLAANLVLPIDSPTNRERSLAVAAEVARCVPFARLSFRPDSDIERLLRRSRAGLTGGR